MRLLEDSCYVYCLTSCNSYDAMSRTLLKHIIPGFAGFAFGSWAGGCKLTSWDSGVHTLLRERSCVTGGCLLCGEMC